VTAQTPFEVIAAPYTIYIAPIATAQPDVSQVPPVAWKKLGTSGNLNYDDSGVTITHDQTVVEWTPVGLTAPRKAFRTEEHVIVEFNLIDMTAAQYAYILNNATVATVVAGVMIGGASKVPLLQGPDVAQWALLARSDQSAAGPAWNSQYYIPVVFQNAAPAPVYKKGDPAGLKCEFRALYDATNGFGQYVSQTATAM
jgi:hypothetical protein